jgi:hypothetical protein
MRVAAPAAATRRDDQPVSFAYKVPHRYIALAHLCAWRDPQQEIRSVLAVLLLRRSVTATFREVLALVPVLPEAMDRTIGDEHDVTAAATVPSVGAAPRNELLAVKADESVSTIAATGVYFSVIYQSW